MKNYKEELTKAMTWLGDQPGTLFIGQSVAAGGTAMHSTLGKVMNKQKLELPVFEETQMGMSTGLGMQGYKVISVYPRFNFLLLATNQIVNHLDKLYEMTTYKPTVIIRTGIGSINPLHPGPQHTGDFTEVFARMCKNIKVKRLDDADDIVPSYMEAYCNGGATILVEVSDKLNEK